MRIVVDCRYVRVDRHDGISRYTAGLVTALAGVLAGNGSGHTVTMLISDPGQLAHLPELHWHRVGAPTDPREPLVARQVRVLAPDVVFSPMQTMGSWGRNYPLVLTLHDLIYYRNRTPPREFAAPIRLLWRLFHLAWWPQRALLNRADAVVTVSETTAGLIAEHRLTRRPVTVVPNAPEPPSGTSTGLPHTGLPHAERTGALVYMGSFMPYKNVAVLAAAMGTLDGHELHLMSRIGATERARLTALAGRGRLVFHDGADDATYHDLLSRATALVSASKDEGFGIPLVEAMALGTPVVVSDIPVFREVGGDAADFVPADDVAGFVRAVRRLDDPAVWAQRSAAARERAGHYTWEASARVLLALLERVAGGR